MGSTPDDKHGYAIGRSSGRSGPAGSFRAVPALGQSLEQWCRQRLRSDPHDIDALTNLAQINAGRGQFDESAKLLRRALYRKPNSAELQMSLGSVLRMMKRLDEAIRRYEKAVSLRPDYLDARNELGSALLAANRFEEAVGQFQEALALRPGDPSALNNLGNALQASRRIDEAIERYQQALVIDPRLPDVLNNLGCALLSAGRLRETISALSKAIELRPEYAAAHRNLGMALVEFGQHAAALKHFEIAILLQPDNADAHNKMGATLVEMGRLPEACAAYGKALSLSPEYATAHYNLALAKKFVSNDQRFATLHALVDQPAITDEDRLQLHFALGKAYADLGEHVRSFEHFLAGNALKRRTINYDDAETAGEFAHISEVFTRDFLTSRLTDGAQGRVPIFIVGMPRSGTTLVEQILASHPRISGGGELPDLHQLVKTLGSKGQSYLNTIPEMEKRDFQRLGTEYLARIALFGGDADRITDKTPLNFCYLGLIAVALPNARIIHVSRDPRDTCISCFRQLFNGPSVPFSYDLAELGRYYRYYKRLMEHWRGVLPEPPLELRYEDVVEDLEVQGRRLLDFCGLEWDERCLDFYHNRRAVHTASTLQVREPIYRHSIGQWRSYGDLLRPLIEALAMHPSDA